MIDESPTIRTDGGSSMMTSEHATPINTNIITHDDLKYYRIRPTKTNKRQRASSTSPIKRFIQKAPPPPQNVFNTHTKADTLRRQQRQQQRRERKKELKEQYKQQLHQQAETNPSNTGERNLQSLSNIQNYVDDVNKHPTEHEVGEIQVNIRHSSYIPYNLALSAEMQQVPCPQCPTQYLVMDTINDFSKSQPQYVDEGKQQKQVTDKRSQESSNAIGKPPTSSFCDEKRPNTRTRSKSIHCHEYISPLYHEEIVTVVDDCHANLLIMPDRKPRNNLNQRRSRSSSGVNNVVIKNWPDHRQNSYETVIAAPDEENMVINNIDYYHEDERYPTASMPLHSRLSTSNEALFRTTAETDGVKMMKHCADCNDQYYLTRSLHRHQVSRNSSKKRGHGGVSTQQVINDHFKVYD